MLKICIWKEFHKHDLIECITKLMQPTQKAARLISNVMASSPHLSFKTSHPIL